MFSINRDHPNVRQLFLNFLAKNAKEDAENAYRFFLRPHPQPLSCEERGEDFSSQRYLWVMPITPAWDEVYKSVIFNPCRVVICLFTGPLDKSKGYPYYAPSGQMKTQIIPELQAKICLPDPVSFRDSSPESTKDNDFSFWTFLPQARIRFRTFKNYPEGIEYD